MQEFQLVMRAHCISEVETAYEDLLSSSGATKYLLWKNYVQNLWKSRERWCMAWRGAEMRGHQTNNFTEAAVRLFKDVVLSRCKAYNSIALMDFICTSLETYYTRRFRTFANSRCSAPRKLLEGVMKKTGYLQFSDIKQDGDIYYVPSEKDKLTLYEVNVSIGACSCPVGNLGRFCKHQCAVYKFFDTKIPNVPPINTDSRKEMAILYLGDIPDESFYEPLMPQPNLPPLVLSTSEEPSILNNLNTPNMADRVNNIQEEEHILELDAPFNSIVNQISALHGKYGSSNSGTTKLLKRLNTIKNANQWEGFLHHGFSQVKFKQGAKIPAQPTSIARRKAGITRGSKRLPAVGSLILRKKKKRDLGASIFTNKTNAKSH